MDEFKYGIATGGKIIAWFINDHDRDICMGLLEDEHDNCEWEAVEKEEK